MIHVEDIEEIIAMADIEVTAAEPVEMSLSQAIKNDRVELVKKLLHVSMPLPLDALHVAVQSGSMEMLNLLLDHAYVAMKEHDTSLRDQKGCVPLHYAKTIEQVNLLLPFTPIDAKCLRGCTLLHFLADENNVELARYVVNEVSGVELHCVNKKWLSPLMVAGDRGHEEFVLFLLQLKNFWKEECRIFARCHPLALLIRRNCMEGVRVLLSQHLINLHEPVNCDGGAFLTPLQIAIESDKYEMAEMMIEMGASVKVFVTRSPLHHAVQRNNLRMMQLLIDGGATAVQYRPTVYDPQRKKIIANVDEREDLLIDAVERGAPPEVADLLLQHGADVYATNKVGFSAFLIACRKGALPYVEILVAHAHDKQRLLLQVDTRGNNGLHLAISHFQYLLIQPLIDAGIGVNARNSLYKTPLERFLRLDEWSRAPARLFEVLLLLLRNGATGTHSIYNSSRGKQEEVREALVMYGADPVKISTSERERERFVSLVDNCVIAASQSGKALVHIPAVTFDYIHSFFLCHVAAENEFSLIPPEVLRLIIFYMSFPRPECTEEQSEPELRLRFNNQFVRQDSSYKRKCCIQ